MKPKEDDQVRNAGREDPAGQPTEYTQLGPGRQQEELVRALDRIARATVSANRLEEVLKLAVEQAVEVLGGVAGIAWVHDAGPNRLRRVASYGSTDEAPSVLLDLATALAERVASERRASRTTIGSGSQEQFAALSLPLVAFDHVVGVMALLRGARGDEDVPEAYTEGDERSLQLLATQAASAVQSSRLFEQLRDANQRLQEAERLALRNEKLAALGEMNAKVTHEIRNPLSSIGGFARRIEKGLPEKNPHRAYATVIVREIDRLEAILAEQLQLAKTSEPQFRMLNLKNLLRETIMLVREEIDNKGIQFVEQGAGGIPAMLLDGDRVKQVLLNILKNAVSSTRKGQTIRLRTRVSEGWVQIEIANNGERIPGEILEQLFVPFASAREGGSGLGMAIADQIVKQHGGEIRVRTTSEWSAVFTVSLPIRTNSDRRRKANRRAGSDRRRAA